MSGQFGVRATRLGTFLVQADSASEAEEVQTSYVDYDGTEELNMVCNICLHNADCIYQYVAGKLAFDECSVCILI